MIFLPKQPPTALLSCELADATARRCPEPGVEHMRPAEVRSATHPRGPPAPFRCRTCHRYQKGEEKKMEFRFQAIANDFSHQFSSHLDRMKPTALTETINATFRNAPLTGDHAEIKNQHPQIDRGTVPYKTTEMGANSLKFSPCIGLIYV